MVNASRTSGSTEMATITWDESTRKVMCLDVSWNESRFLRYLPMQAMRFLGQMPLKYFFTLMDPQMLKKPTMKRKAKLMILPLMLAVLFSIGRRRQIEPHSCNRNIF